MVDCLVGVHAEHHADSDGGGAGPPDAGRTVHEQRFAVTYAHSEIVDETVDLVEVWVGDVFDRAPQTTAPRVRAVPRDVVVVAADELVFLHEADDGVDAVTAPHRFDVRCDMVLAAQPESPHRGRQGNLVDATVGVERHESRG